MPSSKITTVDLEEPIVETLNTIDTVASQITVVDSNVSSIKGTVESNNTLLNNATYGLNALKAAISEISTAVQSSGNKIAKAGTDFTLYNSTTSTSITNNSGTISNATGTLVASVIVPYSGVYKIDGTILCSISGGYTATSVAGYLVCSYPDTRYENDYVYDASTGVDVASGKSTTSTISLTTHYLSAGETVNIYASGYKYGYSDSGKATLTATLKSLSIKYSLI